jgi:hypothetical protein
MLKVYVLDGSTRSIITSVALLDSTNNTKTWYYRSYTIAGLNPNVDVYIAFGRPDQWSTDYALQAQWAGVTIVPLQYPVS